LIHFYKRRCLQFEQFLERLQVLDLKRSDARLWLTSASVSPDRDLMNDPYLPT